MSFNKDSCKILLYFDFYILLVDILEENLNFYKHIVALYFVVMREIYYFLRKLHFSPLKDA